MKNDWQAQIQPIFDALGGFLWGWPMLVALTLTGLYFTFMLKGLQFKILFPALKMALSEKGRTRHEGVEGDISHFQALMTALCATVGTGNIAGVGTAVALGGPGALFWMWMIGLVGMATKYAEAVLGVHYRVKNEDGEMNGGPMYYISHGLKMPWLAGLFAIFLIAGTLGIGNMVQSNSIADLMQSTFGLDYLVTGIILAILTALVILGGIQRISHVAETVVPGMILLYVVSGILILVLNVDKIPDAFALIFHDAFYGTAAAGGFAGAAIKEVLRQGFSRGVFSNESGIGSAPIAAAAATTCHPVEQAMVSMTQTFIDTIVVCTFTGLTIVLSGLWLTGDANGASLTAAAFGNTLSFSIAGIPLGNLIVTICLMFFAFTTILGWGYYGQKAASYLFGEKVVMPYKAIFLLCVVLGAIIQLELAWNIAEICVGLMIIPNLFALWWLSPKVKHLTVDYFRNERDGLGYQVEPFHKEG